MLRHTILSVVLWTFSFAAYGELAFKQDLFTFNLTPDTAFNVGLRTLLVSDPQRPLTWTTSATRPDWFAFSAAAETLSAQPTTTNFGTFSFRLVVKDPNSDDGAIAQVNVVVSDAPRWARNPIPLGVQVQDQSFTYDLRKEILNPQSDLTITAVGLPKWMSISSDGVLSGVPSAMDLGNYSGIAFTAATSRGTSDNTGFGSVIASGARLTISGSKWLPINVCRKVTVNQENADGSALIFAFDRTISLALSGAVADTSRVFSNDNCSAPLTDQVTVPSGMSHVDIYLRGTVEGDLTLAATSDPLMPGSASFFVLPADSVLSLAMSITDGSQRSLTRQCVAVDVQLKDGTGTAFIAPFDTAVQLTSDSTLYHFYADAACSTTESQAVIARGASAAKVYVSSQSADGAKILHATNSDYEAAEVTYEFVDRSPVKLKLTLQKSALSEMECVTASVKALHALDGDAEIMQPLPIDLSALGVSGASARFFSDTSCASTTDQISIPVGASAASFSFSFTQSGSATVAVQSTPPITGDQAAVTITAPPKFVLAPASGLDFGELVSGSSRDMSAVLSNSGATAALGAIAVTGTGFTLAPTTACKEGDGIATGSGCEIRVRFTPDSEGAKSGMLTVVTPNGVLSVALRGSGSPARFALAPVTGLDFGEIAVGANNVLAATLTNTGSSGPIGAFSAAGADFALSSDSSCVTGQLLATNASCAIRVRFAPSSSGAKTGSLSLATASGSLSVALRGSGLPPKFAVSPAVLAFGQMLVGTTKDLSAVFSNSGATGSIGSFAVSGDGFQLSSNSTCQTGQVLAAGATCEIHVLFAPTSEGAKSGTLTISSASGVLNVSLQGSGAVAGKLVLDPSTALDFGVLKLPGTNSACVQAVHTGGLPVQILLSKIAPSQMFVLDSAVGCPSQACSVGLNLTAGQKCSVRVKYAPTNAGVFAETLGIVYASQGQNTTLFLPLRGSATVPPPPPAVWIAANGVTGQVVAAVTDNVTIAWNSERALSCTMTQNDFAARYPRGGSWSGPSFYDTTNPGMFVAGSSAPAWFDVTYTLTCQNDGGKASAAVRVRRWVWAAGGQKQVSYILGSQQDAVACSLVIKKGANLDPTCRTATWGTAWADGTQPPWAVKPGYGPGGGKWCNCFNPSSAPAGKRWAAQGKMP